MTFYCYQTDIFGDDVAFFEICMNICGKLIELRPRRKTINFNAHVLYVN